MPAQKMVSNIDVIKHPQYVAEGTTPGTYGVTPDDPAFVLAGQHAALEIENDPTFIDRAFGGYRDRRGKDKVREDNKVTLDMRVTPDDFGLLRWCMHGGGGAGTPAEHRTFIDSYRDNAGDEIFRVCRGCKPVRARLTISETDYHMLNVEMMPQTVTESDAPGITLGAGAYKSGVREDKSALRFRDAGDALMYGATAVNWNQLSIEVNHTYRQQKSSGSEHIVYCEPTIRRITGSVDVYKSGAALNEEARKGLARAASVALQKHATADAAASARIPAAGANYVTYTAVHPGAAGNSVRVAYAAPAANAGDPLTVGVTRGADGATTITVTPAHGGSSHSQIRDAVNASILASSYLKAALHGAAGTSVMAAVPAVTLAGGVSHARSVALDPLYFLPSMENHRDQQEATMESKSIEADALTVYGPV